MKLSDIKAAADEKYAPVPVELDDGTIVLLRLPIRLTKAERTKISEALKIDEDTDKRDAIDIYAEVFRIVADSAAGAKALIKELGDDLATWSLVFEGFMEAQQSGEAPSSES